MSLDRPLLGAGLLLPEGMRVRAAALAPARAGCERLRVSDALPRFLSARAARLSAALFEGLLEVRGHAGLLARLSDASFIAAFSRGLGLEAERSGPLLRALARGLAREGERLGLRVDPRGGRVSFVQGLGVLVPEPRAPVPRDATAHAALETRLGAHLRAAYGPLPAALSPLSRAPGVGPRTALALSLLSELWFGAPEPALLGLALGSAGGTPAPVPLAVYDLVLVTLERMLFEAPARVPRLGPLFELYGEVERASRAGPPASLARFCAREQRLAKELGGFTRAGPTRKGDSAPRLRGRPTRKAKGAPVRFSPAPIGEAAALEDLFLP